MKWAAQQCVAYCCSEVNILLEYKTVAGNTSFSETEKRSKFVSYVFMVNSEEDVKEKLHNVKAKHWDAKHWVYAYRLAGSNTEKYSDDGEPSGTAGVPVMNAIKSFDLQNVLVIVVRYFGGILLGSAGLRKMYGSGATNVLKKSKIKTYVLCKHLILDVDYKDYGKVSYILSKCNFLLINTEYADKIRLDGFVKKENLNLILKECREYKILEDSYECVH